MTDKPKPIEKPKNPPESRFVEEDFKGVIFDHSEAEGGPIDFTEGPDDKDNRVFVDAVLYRYRAGIPWRDLSERFGDPIAIHTRFSRWAKAGVWRACLAIWPSTLTTNMR